MILRKKTGFLSKMLLNYPKNVDSYFRVLDHPKYCLLNLQRRWDSRRRTQVSVFTVSGIYAYDELCNDLRDKCHLYFTGLLATVNRFIKDVQYDLL